MNEIEREMRGVSLTTHLPSSIAYIKQHDIHVYTESVFTCALEAFRLQRRAYSNTLDKGKLAFKTLIKTIALIYLSA